MPPAILPEAWNLVNYRVVMGKFPFGMFYWNTFAMMGMTVLVQLVVCSMAGYAFARLSFPGKEFLFTLCLALLMVPGQIFLVPHYDIMRAMEIDQHHHGAVVAQDFQRLWYLHAAGSSSRGCPAPWTRRR